MAVQDQRDGQAVPEAGRLVGEGDWTGNAEPAVGPRVIRSEWGTDGD